MEWQKAVAGAILALCPALAAAERYGLLETDNASLSTAALLCGAAGAGFMLYKMSESHPRPALNEIAFGGFIGFAIGAIVGTLASFLF